MCARRASSPRGTSIRQPPFALFFARIEAYKGVDVLVEAMRLVSQFPDQPQPRVVIAGRGNSAPLVSGVLPANVEIRNRLIEDREAIDLFRRCSVVVLPYLDATQSALIAAAYFFGKPVIVTRVGALPEYVIEGETGWVITPHDPVELAGRLREALSDRDRLARMGDACRKWYQAQRRAERNALRLIYEFAGNEGNGAYVQMEQATGGSNVDD